LAFGQVGEKKLRQRLKPTRRYCSFYFDSLCLNFLSTCPACGLVWKLGFYPQLGQRKDYKIGICCFSGKHILKLSNPPGCLLEEVQ